MSKEALVNSHVRIQKMDAAEQIAYGVVYAPNEIDTWGDMMRAEDIKKMAHRFMQLDDVRKTIDTMHDEESNGSYPIESFIARAGDPDYPEGAWVLGVKIPDKKLWQRVEKGELAGFSFQAMVRKLPAVVELDVSVDNFGQTEQFGDHTHLFWAEINDDGQVVAGRTSTVKGHSHEILGGTKTEEALGHSHRFFV